MSLIEIGAGFALGICFIGAIFFLADRLAARRYMAEKGSKGYAAKKENEDRMSAAAVELFSMVKEGKPFPEIAKELLPKYPDVALKLAKKAPQLLNELQELKGGR